MPRRQVVDRLALDRRPRRHDQDVPHSRLVEVVEQTTRDVRLAHPVARSAMNSAPGSAVSEPSRGHRVPAGSARAGRVVAHLLDQGRVVVDAHDLDPSVASSVCRDRVSASPHPLRPTRQEVPRSLADPRPRADLQRAATRPGAERFRDDSNSFFLAERADDLTDSGSDRPVDDRQSHPGLAHRTEGGIRLPLEPGLTPARTGHSSPTRPAAPRSVLGHRRAPGHRPGSRRRHFQSTAFVIPRDLLP